MIMVSDFFFSISIIVVSQSVFLTNTLAFVFKTVVVTKPLALCIFVPATSIFFSKFVYLCYIDEYELK